MNASTPHDPSGSAEKDRTALPADGEIVYPPGWGGKTANSPAIVGTHADSLLMVDGQSEELIRQFVEHLPVPVAMFDRHMRYLVVSRRWLEHYDLEHREVIGQLHYDLFPDIPVRWRIAHQRSLAGQILRCEKDWFERDNGEIEWLRWELCPWRTASGEVGGVILFSEIITDQHQAEQLVRDREERMRSLLDTVADAIVTIDSEGTIQSVNSATERMFGYLSHELVGQNVRILMPEPYYQEHDNYLRRYHATRQPRLIGTGRELVARRKDGSTFPVGLAVNEMPHLGLFTGIVRDISAERALQKQVLEIASEQDRRIGQELHDSIQQQLTGLGLLAQNLVDAVTDHYPVEAPLASRVASGIKEVTRQVHLLSRGLIPVEIDAEGLSAALRGLVTRLNNPPHLSCVLRCPSPVQVTDNFTATHLYRIAQEAVNNALKHSHADQIEIVLASDAAALTLEVRDNGLGIRNKRQSSQGMGLRIMQYRAGLIGGTVQIDARDGGGTRVRCTVFRGSLPHGQSR
ncbi:MAG: PAS domain S-box protein [Planctomycetales bacterium]|nr:PAS domain S-box protein [Planctomycetales bacterium]